MKENIRYKLPENLNNCLDNGDDFTVELQGEYLDGKRVMFYNACEFREKHPELLPQFDALFTGEARNMPLDPKVPDLGEKAIERAVGFKTEGSNSYIAVLVEGEQESPQLISAILFNRNPHHKDNADNLAYEILDLASLPEGTNTLDAIDNMYTLTDVFMQIVNTDTKNDKENVASIFASIPFHYYELFRRIALLKAVLFSIRKTWSLESRADIDFMKEMNIYEIDKEGDMVTSISHALYEGSSFGGMFNQTPFVYIRRICRHSYPDLINRFITTLQDFSDTYTNGKPRFVIVGDNANFERNFMHFQLLKKILKSFTCVLQQGKSLISRHYNDS